MSLFDELYDEVFGDGANLLSNLFGGLGYEYWLAVMAPFWDEEMVSYWDTPMSDEAYLP